MSAYVALATPMTDQDCLLAALSDMGFSGRKVEVHSTAVPLVGYRGDTRAQAAHIVLRRKHVGRLSNDIGFERTAAGFQAHISEYDQRRYSQGWLLQLQVRYLVHDAARGHALAAQARDFSSPAGQSQAQSQARTREAERKRAVEAQRQSVHEKARKLGYRVEESRMGDTVRLVLTKPGY